jgi:signal transduction histidine kinase
VKTTPGGGSCRIDEGIDRDAATEMLRAVRQGSHRHRPRLLALVSLEADLRRLARGAVRR